MGNECQCHHAEVEYGHTSFHVVDPKMRDEHVEDRPTCGELLIVDVKRMHLMALIGIILLENPFFVPPEELWRQLRERCAPFVGLDPRGSGLSAD